MKPIQQRLELMLRSVAFYGLGAALFVLGTFSAAAQPQVELYRWVDFPLAAPGAASGVAKWDVLGTCAWTHENGTTTRTSRVWYSGSGDTYVYRFGASLPGRWTGTTSSSVAALNGLQLIVDVVPSSNPNRTGWSGRIQNDQTAWARQQGANGQLVKRTPILIMMPQVQNWYNNLGSMAAFVAEFNNNHGFNGGHLPTIGRGWFEAGSTGNLSSAPATPDVQTFAALEAAAADWSDRGGWLHIWMWGKGSAGDFSNLPGGYNGAQSKRINRYIAARLGPVPGWSMGIGWDVEFWITQTKLKWWLDDLTPQLGGWHHWIGHRYSDSDIGQGGDPEPANKGEYLSRGLTWNTLRSGAEQYAGWEQWFPLTSNAAIDAGLAAIPSRPMMSEDRFRRRDGVWPQKDLLSDSAILDELPRWANRGVAAIYGRLIQNGSAQGSDVWPNKAQIKAAIANLEGGAAPTAPSGLTATAISTSQINLNWTDNSNNETQFRIERKTGGGSFGFLANKGANVTSHSDTGLQSGTTYTYRVRAENSNGNSAWSNEASATTQSSGGGLVSNLTVASGKAYVVVPSLANGELVYIDRTFTWSSVGAYAGLAFIRTANDDKSRTETSFLSFDVSQAVTVYVAYDVRAASLPNWLSSWTDTTDILGTTDVDRRVYSKPFSAGTVTLGGNAASGMSGANSMYSVIIATSGGSGGAFQESGGEVVMEGENFHALDGRTDPNGVNWQTASSITGAVGGQYIQTPGPQGTNGEWSNACEASYNVNFATPGTYNVWVRRYAVDGAQNSISAGLNGVQTTGVDNTTDYNAWVWKKLATVSVSSAGIHTFQLRRREAGYKVDRIILRTSSATPSGNGPAESPQSGGGGGGDVLNGIAGYWKLNETSGTTASDSSGNGLHGTLFNGPVWSGGTLAFDGVNDYVDVGNPSQLQFTGAMTVSAWIRINSFNNGRIIAKQGGSSNRGWTLNVTSGGLASFQIADSNNTGYRAETAPLATNTWYHLVGVYEPGVAVRIYVNAGAPISNTTSIPSTQRNSTLNVNIGRRPDASSDTHFNGNIDDVRAYNRVLSAAEITTLFNNGAQ